VWIHCFSVAAVSITKLVRLGRCSIQDRFVALDNCKYHQYANRTMPGGHRTADAGEKKAGDISPRP
jgi:hypothetical protein